MATLQNESGTNLYPRTYTEKVFDKNGDAINDRVAYVGSEITGDTVAPITPYLNQSDIVNDLTTGGTTKPLSAEQGKVLNQNLTELRPDGIGVITSLTTSAKEGTVIDDAFSNYDMILIVADDTGDARRASMILPMTSFIASSNNILTFLAGGQAFTMSVKYKTDTKFEAYLSASTSGLGITMQCKVYGMMKR